VRSDEIAHPPDEEGVIASVPPTLSAAEVVGMAKQ
jgi:hypothetical protein